MYNNIIIDHLTRIKSELIGEKSIIAYKGFPPYFVKQISEHFGTIESIEPYITSKGRYDLNKIEVELQRILAALLSSELEVIVYPYEILYRLTSIFDVSITKRKVVVVNNTLFRQFPNSSNISVTDIEIELNTAEPKIQQQILDKFYSNSLVQFGSELIEYPDLSESLEVVNEIAISNSFSKDFEKVKFIKEKELSNITKHVVFDSSDSTYGKFKSDLFWDLINHDINLIIDEFPNKDSLKLKELGVLEYLFNNSQHKLSIFIIEKEKKNYYREEFKNILNTHWGSSKFREIKFYKNPAAGLETHLVSQGAIIEEIVTQAEKGINREVYKDIFLTAPTGSGKSILFQIPAIYLAEKHQLVTIVISPLKALMKDQVTDLNKRNIHNAKFINSDISLIERNQIIDSIKEGHTSILYLSPELLLSYQIQHFIGERRIGLFVIDEAHLVTTWGRDFRVDYWFLGNYITRLRKYHNSFFPVLAVTATAVYDGPDDLVFETLNSLNMQMRELYIGDVRRGDIEFNINKVKYDKSYEDQRNERTLEQVVKYIKEKKKAIVYFPWTNQIEWVMQKIPQEYNAMVNKYYGNVTKEIRNEVLAGFKENDLRVVLATKAFGMGVDISDIEEIYHHAPSGNLSDYIQEVGRVARRKDINGIARVDFNDKDLKYTKILYGLSAIRQYHVKRVLQKLFNIYKIKNNRNFLVSIEDFRFIFSEEQSDDNIERKVKSSLLLLERDLLAKYRYNVIIVRPKSLFSTVYVRVDKDYAERFEQKYSNYIKIVHRPGKSKQIKDGNQLITLTPNQNPVYSFKLNELWENDFPDESFPKIKKYFFDDELFTDFIGHNHPQYKMKITLNSDSEKTLNSLKLLFGAVESAFLKLGGGFFTKNDLNTKLKDDITNASKRAKISDLLTAIFSTHRTIPSRKGRMPVDKFCFLQKKRVESSFQYRLFSNNYLNIKRQLERLYHKLFQDNQVYEGYISADPEKNKLHHDLAYVLESFDLGTYELEGGQRPQLFIRINDPNKIDYLSYSEYSNEIVREIEDRHKSSVKIMSKFFMSDLENQNRWNFIEKYFIGYDIEDIIDS